MVQGRFFCAAESRANVETVYGTVARISSWLLLEHPSVWRRNAVQDSWALSPELKRYIRGLPIDRALMIRQEHHHAGPLHCIFVQSCADPPSAARHMLSDYNDLYSVQGPGEPFNELMFAVCTHGRHDKCCAKFGIPVWHAFRDAVGKKAWQCSHVGGDRFAANVIVFPYGIYYGRVLPEHVPEILARSNAGEVWLPAYRGRSCFPRLVQVAEYFVRRVSGRLRIDEFRPLDVLSTTPGGAHIKFRARSDETVHGVEFAIRPDALRQRLTCDAEEPSDIVQYELRNYAVSKH